jgi:hypothetical protein
MLYVLFSFRVVCSLFWSNGEAPLGILEYLWKKFKVQDFKTFF